ncbi:hypothetical protein NDU88_005788 [Pleurodeles waltl]|uniref:Uncharacterized protein n=1 Tax=Pleurodeles waltl TaxID=8319 RepID=A0AAV7PGE8_PLEWA|nr:hypothetical protein NDU88_005788 [Pleurodeles waltl]
MSAGPQTPGNATGSRRRQASSCSSPRLEMGPFLLQSGGLPGPPTHRPATASLLDVPWGAAVSQAAPPLPNRQGQQLPGKQTHCSPRPQYPIAAHHTPASWLYRAVCDPSAPRGGREPPLETMGPPGAPLLLGSGQVAGCQDLCRISLGLLRGRGERTGITSSWPSCQATPCLI